MKKKDGCGKANQGLHNRKHACQVTSAGAFFFKGERGMDEGTAVEVLRHLLYKRRPSKRSFPQILQIGNAKTRTRKISGLNIDRSATFLEPVLSGHFGVVKGNALFGELAAKMKS